MVLSAVVSAVKIFAESVMDRIGSDPQFRISNDERPDLIYSLEDDPGKAGVCRYYASTKQPIEIEYYLGTIEDRSDAPEKGTADDVVVMYQLVELEELIHAMGVVDVDEDHSQRWLGTLISIVNYVHDENVSKVE